ncbi:chlorophyll synthesis pathway protein BchC [Sphingomicrobium sediminis]|uniref:Chlorophyll synthesis pathway protein BchC n=1 Tax=Sphingomicrobium sediminis TaxID=2950949 RepID=A0A9X2J3T6_9SPHN|nr:chlorophyll synthesis pathway protein BchC [Sphingomicrobium sediminis]MCM8556527.1 chlorophyll synthesis pathway protein BchC [Sphingomicrobium sediminis]
MQAAAVILEAPERMTLRQVELTPKNSGDVVVQIHYSGVSTGTEKLLWTGAMPPFPGMGYPLVPGYESVGRIIDAGADAEARIGEWVFVPGANCFDGARGLFGGSASQVIIPSARALPVSESLGADGVLHALAATAYHALAGGDAPDLVIGHGVLGRLITRLAIARGAPAPVVWETRADRRKGGSGYKIIDPKDDDRRDYACIYDASGSAELVDQLVMRLAKGGEIVLAGFYPDRIDFAFAPAFMKEARLRIAAEWQPEDLAAVSALVAAGDVGLGNLISHVRPATEATEAYPAAFNDADCLKMVLDWSAA